MGTTRITCVPLILVAAWPGTTVWAAVGQTPSELSGAQLYQAACASCHATDGSGTDPRTETFDVQPPDFTDCSFASREPDPDWLAVMHQGGPVRGFSETMPAFGDALPMDDLQRVLDHVRTFCEDGDWPRGELNLPRTLFTEKAYPEDEAVISVSAATEGPGAFTNRLTYERRFGARNQIEIVVPYGALDTGSGDWASGIGDVAVGFKRAVFHSLDRGSILSVAGEVALPTGDDDDGLGKGVTIIEPFVSFGQMLPSDSFFQFQGGLEFPTDTDRAEREGFWRFAIGKTYAQNGGRGRSWTPMLELLGSRELAGGERAAWDLVPQIQVSLPTRQHVLFNLGVRMPVTDAESRATSVAAYLLWDWYDGGFFDGW